MIKVNKASVKIEGSEAMIRSEFCLLAKCLREIFERKYGKANALEMLMSDIEDSMKTVEQLQAEIDKLLEGLSKDAAKKMVEDIING